MTLSSRIIADLARIPGQTVDEIAEALDVPRADVGHAVTALRRAGRLEPAALRLWPVYVRRLDREGGNHWAAIGTLTTGREPTMTHVRIVRAVAIGPQSTANVARICGYMTPAGPSGEFRRALDALRDVVAPVSVCWLAPVDPLARR